MNFLSPRFYVYNKILTYKSRHRLLRIWLARIFGGVLSANEPFVFTIMVDFRFAAVSILTTRVRILLCSFLVSVLTRFGFTPAESSWRRPSAAASSGTPNPDPAKKQWQSYIPGFEEGHGFKSLPDTRLRCSSVEIFPAWKWYQEIKLHPTSHYLVVIESRN